LRKKADQKLTKKGTVITIDESKIREISRRIIELREELNIQLTGLDRQEIQSSKDAAEKVLQARASVYETLKWETEGYLQYRIDQLAQEYSALAEHVTDKVLLYEWLEQRKKELQDEYLRNTDEGYKLLSDLSERTANAIEQSFTDFLFDSMTNKFTSWKDYVYNLLLSMQRITANILGQMAGDWLKSTLLNAAGKLKENTEGMKRIAQLTQEQALTYALAASKKVEAAAVGVLTASYWALAAAKTAAGSGCWWCFWWFGICRIGVRPLGWYWFFFYDGGGRKSKRVFPYTNIR